MWVCLQARCCSAATGTTKPPWRFVQAVGKKSTRLNCTEHPLDPIPCAEGEHAPVVLPERVRNAND